MLLENYLSSINYLAVLVTAVIFWVLGSVWFGALFGKSWMAELEKHGTKIEKPSTRIMVLKSTLTFLMNLLLVIGVGFFVHYMSLSTVIGAFKLGLLIGISFSFTTLLIAYTWENKSLKLLLLDFGYTFFGIIISSIILTLWR
jgi:hypothetical protein